MSLKMKNKMFIIEKTKDTDILRIKEQLQGSEIKFDEMSLTEVLTRTPQEFENKFIAYGSVLFIYSVFREEHKGICNIDHYKIHNYAGFITPDHFLNSDYKIMPVRNFLSLPDNKIINTFAKTDLPSGPKGTLLKNEDDILNFKMSLCMLDSEDPIFTAPKKEILSETRYFYYKSRIFTGSLYKKDNDYFEEEAFSETETGRFAKMVGDRLASQYENIPYTIDIAETPDGMKLIEINCPFASGLYNSCSADFISMLCRYLADRF